MSANRIDPRDPTITVRITGAKAAKRSEWSHPAWGAMPHFCAHPLAGSPIAIGDRELPQTARPGSPDLWVAPHPPCVLAPFQWLSHPVVPACLPGLGLG